MGCSDVGDLRGICAISPLQLQAMGSGLSAEGLENPK